MLFISVPNRDFDADEAADTNHDNLILRGILSLFSIKQCKWLTSDLCHM